MWVCNRCYQENNDQDAVCRGCGTQRVSGRFQAHQRRAAMPPPEAPLPPSQPVVSPAQAVSEPVRQRPARAEFYAPPPFDPPKLRRSPIERLSVAIGASLLILLPLLTAAFAWRQYDALSAALIPLLLAEDAASIVKIILYVVLSLIAALLSALPGLFALLAARRPLPRGIKHSSARKTYAA